MKFIKCPRCELNYIEESEKYCKVCYRARKGEEVKELEVCSVCNSAPVLQGYDLCASCQSEIGGKRARNDNAEDETREGQKIGMHGVSEMDEIIPEGQEDDIPPSELSDIENAFSLESMAEEEAEEDEEEND